MLGLRQLEDRDESSGEDAVYWRDQKIVPV